MKAMNDKTKRTVRAAVILVVVFVLCFFLGFGIGMLAEKIKDSGLITAGAGQSILQFITYRFPYVYLVFMVAVTAICFRNSRKAKQIYTSWDEENEEVIDQAECLLNENVLFSNILFILDFFMFGLWIFASERVAPDMIWGTPIQILVMVMFVAGWVLAILIQRSVVELEKKINPEKRGELLEFRFTKEWQDSFDEAQKMMQYKAAYKALSVVNVLLPVMWTVCLIGELLWNMGVEALIFITIIWLVSTIVYQVEAMHLESAKRK